MGRRSSISRGNYKMPRCGRCNKELTNPRSIARGYGDICWNEICAERERIMSQNKQLPLLPFDGDIICKRTKRGTQFNINQAIIYHSPTGMEWGYGGSGSADFALNILALFTDEQTAWLLHQDFKWKYVATLPKEGGTIRKRDIIRFIKKHSGTVKDEIKKQA